MIPTGLVMTVPGSGLCEKVSRFEGEQLSTALCVPARFGTVMEQVPEMARLVSLKQLTTGSRVSIAVMKIEQLPMFPLKSIAVINTVIVSANRSVAGLFCANVNWLLAVQLSVAETNGTRLPTKARHWLFTGAVMFPGQLMTGKVPSWTVKLNWQVCAFPSWSIAWMVML